MRKTIITLALALVLQIPLKAHQPPKIVPDGGFIFGVQQSKPLKPLPSLKLDGLPELPVVEVAVAAPAPVNSVSQNGCVTGYVSGDYYLDKIISFESSGNSCITNQIGCFGLLQACPGEPLRAACGGYPICQIKWFQANKTNGRSWAQVWQHELDFGWW